MDLTEARCTVHVLQRPASVKLRKISPMEMPDDDRMKAVMTKFSNLDIPFCR